MKTDLSQKRGQFIGKMISFFQEFHYVDPDVFVMLINIFNTSFYGSALWDIFSPDCDKFYKSWNVSMRKAFDVDRCTHRYLIESISDTMHPKVMISARYVTFWRALVTSSKFAVRLLAKISERDTGDLLQAVWP